MRFFSKTRTVWLVAALAAALTIPLAASAAVRKGEQAPPLKVVSTAGQNITLANYQGHVLVLDFFASWCGPCRESIPHLVELNSRYGRQGLQILGLSADEDRVAVKEFIAEKKINYPVAMTNDKLLDDYAVRSIPTLYVINKKGVVVGRFMGFSDETAKSMEAQIKKLLAE
ncbi:MAG TPA: TlpA disulfide reductase family protein [Geobacteraceae bacterium]